MVNSLNFTKLLFFSEIAWLVLYNYTILAGTLNDDLNLLSLAFFILGLAGLEFSIGMLLVIIFKKILRLEYFSDYNIPEHEMLEQLNKIIKSLEDAEDKNEREESTNDQVGNTSTGHNINKK